MNNYASNTQHQENVPIFTSSRKQSIQNKSAAAQEMNHVGRTQGDGMENVTQEDALEQVTPDTIVSKQAKSRLGDSLIYHPKNLKQLDSIPPVMPTGMVVNLIPKNVTEIKKERHILNSLKLKEPKFVPYEPYKAAVNPIVPYEKKTRKPREKDIDINVAGLKISGLEISKHDVHIQGNVTKSENDESKGNWDVEKKAYETEIQKLKEENSQLENQLKFQAQVNGELKNLLVAAVGEDLETKVHILTEDKLQLARALLNSAQHLNTHQEQTEWLAGQCEVWRSKFLASSLMVEELARWKAALCQRTTDLQETMKRLLEERNQVRDMSLKTYRLLCILREKFDPVSTVTCKKHELPSTNVMDLARGCWKMADILTVQLLSGMQNMSLQREIVVAGLEMKTSAEKNAEQLLMSTNFLTSGRQDAACSAVMGAAVAIGGSNFLPKSHNNLARCPHCSGEIKQV